MILDIWNRKEAYLKATGRGLIDMMSPVKVPIEPEIVSSYQRSSEDIEEAGGWRLVSIDEIPHYVGSLVINGYHWTLLDRDFEQV